jgi:filamentous hemagglutinin family protein
MDASTARSRHPNAMRPAFLWAFLPTLVLFLIAPSVGEAQQVVTTNITQTTGAGNLGTTVIHQAGSNLYNITDGTRPGGGPNLFHSFGNFSVGAGDIANFSNNTGLFTSNILGRVTGGSISNIFGTIQTTGFGNANLFLMNPSGFVFGPNASLNVGGSVSFTTAQYIRLFDGVSSSANFYANPANDGLANSILTIDPAAFAFLSAAPAAYGFVTPPDPNASITVQGSALSVPSGQSISLVGGKVVIQGAPLPDGTVQPAQLSAPNGTIQLASAASPGEFAAPAGQSLANATTLQAVPNNPVDPASASAFTSYGLVSMAANSSIDVHGASTVWIKGGQLVLSVNDATLNTSASTAQSDTISLSLGSSIVTSNVGADPGADVQLIASNVQLDGASIQSMTTGSGRGGDISIAGAQTVNLTNGAQVVSRTDGSGDGGAITVSATDAVSISGFDTTGTLSGVAPFGIVASGVYSTASADGNGGQISVTAPAVTLDSAGMLATINTGDGAGGNISINATTVGVDGAFVLSSTGLNFTTGEIVGSGKGGNVTVQGMQGAGSAADSVTLSNGANIFSLTFGPGHGGDVQIAAETIGLDGGATAINTSTFGDGTGGNITADAGTLSVTNGASILTQSFGLGRGGDVSITAGTLAMENFANILTNSSGDGVGGNLALNVGTLSLDSFSTIQSQNSTGTGLGGNLTIQGLQGAGSAAKSVVLSGAGSLLSQTSGSGDGSPISITAESVTMSGQASINSLTIGTGRAGDILMAVQQLNLSGGATISSSTNSFDVNLAQAGNITVQGLDGPKSPADSVTLSGPGTAIQMLAPGFGHTGDIRVNAKTLNLTDNAAISAGTIIDTGTAGDVILVADSIGISGGSIISSQAFSAPAGQVTITANQLAMDKGSIVTTTSSSTGSSGGNVVLDVGKVSLTNGSRIQSESSGTGRGGDITMNVGTLSLTNSTISSASTGTNVVTNIDGTTEVPGRAGNVTITATGGFTSNASTIATSAEANHGGDISITAQNVQLSNGTLINASSNAPLQVTKLVLDENGQLVPQVVGDGNAGNITINSASTFVMQNSSMTTAASQASGGQITINAPDLVQLVNSNIITSVAGSGTDTTGGNISIDPQFVVLQNSQILAQAFAGSGGAIDINAGVFLADPSSIVDASSTLGISGTVQINAPINNLSSVVGRLPESVLAAQALLRAACAARLAQGQVSSFVERGRDSIPAGPDGLLASPYLPPSSEPSAQTGGIRVGSDYATSSESLRNSGVQVRRLLGPDSASRVTILSGDTACSS